MSAVIDSTPPQRASRSAGDSSDAFGGVKSSPATPPSGDRPFNVYVKNFTADIDDNALHAMFEAFGTIQSCTVLHDHAGRSKQVGFVQFSSDEEAKTAVEAMHSKDGYGTKPLHVALTNKKPINTKRRDYWYDSDYYNYDYSPMTQSLYGSYSASPHSPLSPSPTPHSGSPHMYPSSMPAWSPQGPVQIVFVPWQPSAYDVKQDRIASGWQGNTSENAGLNRTPTPKAPARRTPATPAGQMGGARHYYESHYHGQYMGPGSCGYTHYYPPYPATNGYGGYGSGWGSPYYYQYPNRSAYHNNTYGYA